MSGVLVVPTIEQRTDHGPEFTNLGTPEQVAERIVAYRAIGVDLMLTGFLHVRGTSGHSGARSSRSCASWNATGNRRSPDRRTSCERGSGDDF
ncbi:LLM class flavin-dependent oxidoreductase [Parenemella sanctibonifatiensis]|uniref:LLM class flavin-dependent oxidoreductase n=1 Tax=Parenemella sanctibonifatiensis TaxID=2016505 RepID=UPI001E42ED2E|nr:LLM class flavin-dependent oxidoreductase [Parenemella sanctibonifatiensis]